MGLKFLDNLYLFSKYYEAKEIGLKSISMFNFSTPNKSRIKKKISQIEIDDKMSDSK
jgi:hypothetical protein